MASFHLFEMARKIMKVVLRFVAFYNVKEAACLSKKTPNKHCTTNSKSKIQNPNFFSISLNPMKSSAIN